jgi:hypothetical protein
VGSREGPEDRRFQQGWGRHIDLAEGGETVGRASVRGCEIQQCSAIKFVELLICAKKTGQTETCPRHCGPPEKVLPRPGEPRRLAIPALGRLRQEVHEFEASLGYDKFEASLN